MAQVIELCRRCGFDIPEDASDCPTCGPPDEAPTLAALQVAGLALPTRSVHPLPTTPPRRERVSHTIGPARGARSAFECTSLLVVVTLLGATAAWVVGLPQFELAVPKGTIELIDDLTELAAWAAVIVCATGLVASLVWCVRRIGVDLAQRHERDVHLLP